MADRQSRTFFGIFINGNQATDTLKNMRSESRKLKNEIANLVPGTEQYRRKMEELAGVEKHIRRHRDEVAGLNSVWAKVKTEAKAFGVVALAALGAGAIISGVNNMVRRLATLSDAWADVRKTTGFTESQIEAVDKKLSAMNTRTPRSELIKLAAEAGRQGKKTVDEVAGFVKEYDILTTALGEDVANVIPAIGKLTQIYKASATQIGSALNEIEDASIATANYQVDFLNRTSGLATTIKDISIPIMIGYGATLEQLGQTAEKSGTAVNQILFDFIKNTADFERVAGMVPGTLKRIIGEEGTNEGFLAWLDALKQTNPEAEQMLKALEEIGINGDRGANVLLSLAGNTKLVREQQLVANDAFNEGTSVMDEFNRRQETFGATIDRLTKKLNSWFLNNPVTKGVQSLITGFTNLVDPIKKVSDNLEDERMRLNQLVITYTNVNSSQQARKAALEEIKSAYPSFIKMVNIETASTEELFAALEKVNGEYAARIVIQRKGEDLADQGEDQADALQKQLDQEARLAVLMTEINDQYKIRQTDNETNDEFMKRYAKTIEEFYITNKKGTKDLANVISFRVNEYKNIINQLSIAQKEYNKQTDIYNSMVEERNALEAKLLGNATEVNEVTEDGIKYTELSKEELMKLADAGHFTAKSILENMSAIADEEKKTAEKIAADRKRLDEQLKEIQREHLQWSMGEQEKERDVVANKYEELRQLAHGNSNQILALNQAEKEELARIDAKYAEQAKANWEKNWKIVAETIARVVAESQEALDSYIAESVDSNNEYLQAVMTQQEWEEYLVDQHYMKLIARAHKQGIDTAALYDAWDAARKEKLEASAATEEEIEQQKWDAKKAIAQSAISLIDSIVSIANAKSTKLGKAAAVAQIAIDKASAIGDLVRMATEAAANFGPLGPLVWGGYFASGLALVMGGIKDAKEALTADQAASGGYRDVIGAQSGKKYSAQSVPNWNGGFANNALIVGEEGAEYTVPNWMLRDPYVVNTVEILENIRTHRQMVAGGYADKNTSAIPGVNKPAAIVDSGQASGQNYATGEMISLLKELRSKGVRFVPDDRFMTFLDDRSGFFQDSWENYKK